MPHQTPFQFYIEILIGGYYLWLGAYIFSRSLINRGILPWWVKSDLSAGLFFIFCSLFITSTATRWVVATIEQYVFFVQLVWPIVPLGIFLWFNLYLSILFGPKDKATPVPTWRKAVMIGVAIYMVFLIWAGLATNLIFDYELVLSGSWDLSFRLPPSLPTFHLYTTYIVTLTYLPSVMLWRYWRQATLTAAEKQELRLLTLCSVVLVLGGTMSVMIKLFPGIQYHGVWITEAAAGVGFWLMGRSIANYNAFLENRVIKSDFQQAALSAVIAIIPMVAIAYLVQWVTGEKLGEISFIALVYGPILLVIFFPFLQQAVNRLILPDWEVDFSQQINQIQYQVLTAPNQQMALKQAQDDLNVATQNASLSQTYEVIEKEIGQLLKHRTLDKDDIVGHSALLELDCVQAFIQNKINGTLDHFTTAKQAEFLQQFLKYSICQTFQITDYQTSTPQVDDSERQLGGYILLLAYFENLTRQEIAIFVKKRFQIQLVTSGRSYAQHLTNAKHQLVEHIWYLEQKAVQGLSLDISAQPYGMKLNPGIKLDVSL